MNGKFLLSAHHLKAHPTHKLQLNLVFEISMREKIGSLTLCRI